MTQDQDRAMREAAREWGKKGGRPRTAPHVEGWKGCRCADCRSKRLADASAKEAQLSDHGRQGISPMCWQPDIADDERVPPNLDDRRKLVSFDDL